MNAAWTGRDRGRRGHDRLEGGGTGLRRRAPASAQRLACGRPARPGAARRARGHSGVRKRRVARDRRARRGPLAGRVGCAAAGAPARRAGSTAPVAGLRCAHGPRSAHSLAAGGFRRLQTCARRRPRCSPMPPASTAPCVLAGLGFRSRKHHRRLGRERARLDAVRGGLGDLGHAVPVHQAGGRRDVSEPRGLVETGDSGGGSPADRVEAGRASRTRRPLADLGDLRGG